MKKYDPSSIRNVCLLSHLGVGKTTLAEAACFTAKATAKRGRVENGTSSFDARADEKERRMTISMAVGAIEWQDTKINILDTPGFIDFMGDAKAALRVVETAVILVDAVDGVQVGTEVQGRNLAEVNVARMFFVNAMDKENANFEKALTSLKDAFGNAVAPLVVPIGAGADFKGVVDLVTRDAFEYQKDGNGIGKKIDLPADLAGPIDGLRQQLMESVAEQDETLLNNYLENGTLSDGELAQGLAKNVAAGRVFPLLAGSAGLNIGVDQLLSRIATLAPPASTRSEIEIVDKGETKGLPAAAGGPIAALCFKTLSEEHVGDFNLVRVFSGKLVTGTEISNTTRDGIERVGNMYFMVGRERSDTGEITLGDIGAMLKLKDTHTNDTLADRGATFQIPKISFPEPLVHVAITAKSKNDEEKIGVGLSKLHEEDPVFIYGYRPDIKQSILSTMGEVHQEIVLQSLKHRFKVEVDRKPTRISYRETVSRSAKYVEHTHKKQTGGAGQYGRVFIDLDPLPRGGGYEFVDKIVGGVIDQSFRPSVDKGIRSKLDDGPLAGYPVVDVRVSLVDGKTHPVDSKDVAFQVAGREAFKKAFAQAGPILLEPVVEMTVTVPEDNTGDAMGDLSSRRGKILGMDSGKYTTIKAKVPEAEIQNYSASLRSFTAGRGFYSVEFSHYDPVPPDVAKKIVETANKDRKEEEE